MIRLAVLALLLVTLPAHAQLVLDGSLGPEGPVPENKLPGGQREFLITQDLGRPMGANLFHSFLQFDIPEGDRATFSAETSFDNVIARVTGGISFIRGTLRSTIVGADLYLLNPWGVIFARTARLELQGSLHVSTADSLSFDDGTVFLARAIPDPVLSSALPTAFGFLGETDRGIQFDRPTFLTVPDGETFSAVAGNITVKGSRGVTTLQAPSGRIQLASVGSTATQVPTDLTQFDARSFDEDQLGDTTVFLGAILDARNPDSPAAPEGSVVIRGGRLLVDLRGQILAGGGADEGNVAIDIETAGAVKISNGSSVQSSGRGPRGAIRIVARTLDVTGKLHSLNPSSEPGAEIDVTANSVTVTNEGEIASIAEGSGQGGAIHLVADKLSVTEGAQITASTGKEASEAKDPAEPGPPGPIEVHVGELEVSGSGAQISSINASSSVAGDLSITADSIRVSDTGLVGTETSGSAPNPDTKLGGKLVLVTETLEVDEGGRVQTTTLGSGAGGDLEIDAEIIVVSQGSADAEPGQIAAVAAQSDGNGGNIQIRAASLELKQGGQISATTETAGGAGILDVMATERILLTGVSGDTPSGIFAQSGREAGTSATGDGGALLVHTQGVLDVTDGAVISARTFGTGNAGRVEISADERITVSGSAPPGSSILSAQGVDGNGDDLILKTDVLELLDGGAISASTIGTGNSGDVVITAQRVLISGSDSLGNRSGVFAQTNAPESVLGGNAGNLDITTNERLRVLEGGRVSVASEGSGSSGSITLKAGQALEIADAGEISARALASGKAGSITIKDTDTLAASTGAVITSQATGSGQGGSITITTRDEVTLSGGAKISAESTGSGDAGDITIDAGRKFSSTNSFVSTRAEKAFGGNITITADELIYPLNTDITTDVQSGVGNGGNITIDPRFVVLNHANIVAKAVGGNGGNITINAENFFLSFDSVLNASSELGSPGEVRLTQETDFGSQLAPLPESFLDVAALVPGSCAARGGQRVGSFVVEGREGTPDTPSRLRAGRYTIAERPAGVSPEAERAERRGDAEEAIRHWLGAAVALEEARESRALENALLQLAQDYDSVGAPSQALTVLERAHANTEASSDAPALASVLGLRGRIRARVGATTLALADLDEAIRIARARHEGSLLARLLLDRGNVLASAGRRAGATASYAEAEGLAESRSLLAMLRSNQAALSISAEDYAPAKGLLDQARRDLKNVPDSHEKAFTLLSAGRGYHRLNRKSLRLRAAEVFSEAGAIAERIEDPRAASYAWGYLGGLYEEESRHAEALDLTRRALLAAQQVEAPESLYLWQWQMGRLYGRRGESEAAIRAFRSANATLQALRQRTALRASSQRTFAREFPTEPVVKGLVDVLLRRASATEEEDAREALLMEARNALEEFKATEVQDYFQDECVASLRKATPEAVPGAVVIYPVLLPDRTELIVSLPQGMRSVVVPVGSAKLTQQVHRLRHLLEKRTTDEYRRPAAQLYDWLIRPLEKDLKSAQAQALIFVPGGAFRSIPMAALYDDQTGQFLVEKYPIGVAPGLTLTDPRHIEAVNVKLLKAGLTQSVQGYPALRFVAAELDAIEELLGGTTLLNEAFVTSALEQELTGEPYGIVHIASHGEFGGDPENTFLLTYDEKLRMAELAELVGVTEFRDQPLELLVLSACQTAAGDDRAALGLAGVAVKAGARSTLATLWYIDDEASAKLIEEFYRNLSDPTSSRAGALQQAQVHLIRDAKYGHPVFWAPFLLIGSWL